MIFSLSCIVLTILFSSLAFAAKYIFYPGGLGNPKVKLINKLDYTNVYNFCADVWNNTPTKVDIQTVSESANGILTYESADDSWYGMYQPLMVDVFERRVNAFKITLNKNQLDDKTNTFRRSVLTQEFGHAFCLDDNPSSGNQSIMNHDRDRNKLSWPKSDDIDGVINAYK